MDKMGEELTIKVSDKCLIEVKKMIEDLKIKYAGEKVTKICTQDKKLIEILLEDWWKFNKDFRQWEKEESFYK